ncbi:MAG: TSUP family transporter [Magnetococcales bacterium]|nr:TSUP family transporter [Magnetococcales bacterium]
MSRDKQDKRTPPFCRQGWKLPLVVLTVSCMGTFAWALHLVWEHRSDLGGVNYIYALQDQIGLPKPALPATPGGKGPPAAVQGVIPPPVVGPAGTPAPNLNPAPTTGNRAGLSPGMNPLPAPGNQGVAAPGVQAGARTMPGQPGTIGMTQPVAATNPQAAIRTALVSIAGYRDTGDKAPGELVGSGVLIGGEGYVATAAHLIEGWKQLRVLVATPTGPREYPARPMKIVAEHNLAVVKLSSTELFPYLPPVDFSMVPPGTRVVAWGNDRAGSVIAQSGLVAGTPTTVTIGKRTYAGLIPTDGLLYHWAQSGGPLLDEQFRLVGIDMIFKDGNDNIRGFFVPAALLRAHFRDVLSFPTTSGGTTGNNGSVTPGGNPSLNTWNGGSPQPGTGFPPPAMQTVAAVVPAPAPAAPAPPSLAPRRPADKWWDQARNNIQQAFYLRIPESPFDISWMASGDAGHVRANQIFGYPVSIFLGMLLLGFISGVSGGMMTMGGGIIKVTGLMAIFGYGIVLVRPVAYITNIFMYGAAALRYKKANLVDWASVRPMIPWAMAGMVGGYYVGILLDVAIIRILLGLFALSVGAKMLREIWERRQRRDNTDADSATRQRMDPDLAERGTGPTAWNAHEGFGAGILGFPMGVVSGILGITGGVVEVPLQRYVNKVTLRVAIANSAILVFFASLVGSVVAMTHGGWTGAFEMSTPLVMAMILLPGAYLGGMLGSWLTTVVHMDILRWIYAVFMFVIAGRMWTE